MKRVGGGQRRDVHGPPAIANLEGQFANGFLKTVVSCSHILFFVGEITFGTNPKNTRANARLFC